MRAIELCRTAALGGHVEQLRRLRADPRAPTTPAATGTARSARAWRAPNGSPRARPSCCRCPTSTSSSPCRPPVAAIAFQNKAAVYAILFRAAAETLRTHRRRSAASRRRDRRRRGAAHLGADPAPPSAPPLHRARRRPLARRHALDRLPARVLPAGARAVAPVPRGCSWSELRAAFAAGELRFFGELAQLAEPAAFAAPAAEPCAGIEWVVYAKPPFGGPEQVLAYLGRYTHRVAIANSRLVGIDDDQRQLPLEGLSP